MAKSLPSKKVVSDQKYHITTEKPYIDSRDLLLAFLLSRNFLIFLLCDEDGVRIPQSCGYYSVGWHHPRMRSKELPFYSVRSNAYAIWERIKL